MNENIDLTKILENCPKGTKLYTPVWGEVTFIKIKKDKDCLYHCNGMMYNSNDKHLYICGYDKSDKNNIKKNIYVVDKNGKVLKIYDSGKPQYGIGQVPVAVKVSVEIVNLEAYWSVL